VFIVLCIHAIPWCIDCEFPNPWGHVWDWRDGVLSTCLLAAPFLAGLLALRQGWLVPVSTVLSLLVTQLFGGVPLWSLVANEGRFIVILGFPSTMACFGIGHAARMIGVLAQRTSARWKMVAAPRVLRPRDVWMEVREIK